MVLGSGSITYPYELCSAEQKQLYYGSYSDYIFNQTAFTKPPTCEQTHTLYAGVTEEIAYPGWNSIPEDTIAYCLDNQQILSESYGYPLDPNSTIYMTGYHTMEYDCGTGLELPEDRTDPYQPFRKYMSPYGNMGDCSQYPHANWSPSEQSTASLSPPYDYNWDQADSINCHPNSDSQNEEVLLGLGLYECPELTMGDGSDSCFNQGRGLKLEESFELKAEYFQSQDSNLSE
ncbi:hypothetical protein H072_1694 [Dactylellina haptotyla CBS 200.50]|uniref:Uncharacterized protein n=1 Tax=Dactylellina haptotyla (strain CBS 200.50) TaxID=1284197 RepID=S8BXQ2_DACHA|nr:hypothetical protein H072_1694 [Dactylellina haptotyla CBS 200.50]